MQPLKFNSRCTKRKIEREAKAEAHREVLTRKLKDRYNVHVNTNSQNAQTIERLEALLTATQFAQRCKYTIKIMKRMLVFLAKTMETMARYVDPSHDFVNLDGYGEHFQLQISEYEEMLYDVHDVYLSNVSSDPLATLIVAISTSAMMYSMSRQLVRSVSSYNDVGDQLKQASAAAYNKEESKHGDNESILSELEISPEDIVENK